MAAVPEVLDLVRPWWEGGCPVTLASSFRHLRRRV